MRRNELHKRKWYCADPHFGHDAIVKFCNRPFKNADEADDVIMRNLHERVGPEDQLWLLGDFALGHKKLDKTWLREMFEQLPGAEQHLIVGNHDDELVQSLPWTSVSHVAEVRDGSKQHYNTLFHYPMITWNHARRGAYCLFGHVHDNFLGTRNCINVGLDVWDFYPVSFDEIEKRSKKLPMNKHWHEVEPGATVFGEQIDYY